MTFNQALLSGLLTFAAVARPITLIAQCQDQACMYNYEQQSYQCEAMNLFTCQVISSTSCNEGFCMRLALDSSATSDGLVCSPAMEADPTVSPVSWISFLRASFALQQANSPARVSIRMIPQPDAPAMLIQASYGVAEVLERGVVRNRSHVAIRSIKLGVIAVRRDEVEEVLVSRQFVSPQPVAPAGDLVVRKFGLNNSYLDARVYRSLEFYVAEVEMTDGTVWREDGQTLRRQFMAAAEAAVRAINQED